MNRDIEETVIRTIEEYIGYIEKLPMVFSLARGQNKDYPLYPGAFRKDKVGMSLYSKTDQKQFIEKFKLYAVQYLKDNDIRRENDWLVYAQHFGINTCLLDFTHSPLLALLFAVENAFSIEITDDKKDDYAVVWFLNPSLLNQEVLGKGIINLSNEDSIDKITVNNPFVCTANRNNKRIAAQNGLFVCFKNENMPLEKISLAPQILKKVKIPYTNVKDILKSLYRLGIRFNNIYPEINSISKDIKLEYDVLQYIRNSEE